MKNNKDKKQSLKNSLKNSQTRKIVSLGFSFSYLLMISLNTNASDIEIYRQGSSGANSTIMLMVDTSQTMGSPALDILKDYPLCISGKVFGVLGALPVVDVKLTPPAGTNTEAYCDVVFPKEVLDLLGTIDTITGSGRNSLLD
jgi:type IV pilus assembly protein PilY1